MSGTWVGNNPIPIWWIIWRILSALIKFIFYYLFGYGIYIVMLLNIYIFIGHYGFILPMLFYPVLKPYPPSGIVKLVK